MMIIMNIWLCVWVEVKKNVCLCHHLDCEWSDRQKKSGHFTHWWWRHVPLIAMIASCYPAIWTTPRSEWHAAQYVVIYPYWNLEMVTHTHRGRIRVIWVFDCWAYLSINAQFGSLSQYPTECRWTIINAECTLINQLQVSRFALIHRHLITFETHLSVGSKSMQVPVCHGMGLRKILVASPLWMTPRIIAAIQSNAERISLPRSLKGMAHGNEFPLMMCEWSIVQATQQKITKNEPINNQPPPTYTDATHVIM